MSNNKIILKKSAVPGKKPQPTDLEFGELALNYADGIVYYKTNDNVVAPLSSGDAKPDSVELGIDTTGDYVRSIFTTDPYILLEGNFGESSDVTISLDSSTTASPNTLVARDQNGSSKFNNVEANSVLTNSIISTDTVVLKSSSNPAVNFVDTNNVNLFTIDNNGNASLKNNLTANNLNVGNITIEGVLKLDTTSSIGALIGEEHTIDEFPIDTFRTAKYIVQVANGNKYQSSEILLLHDGVSAFANEFAVIETDVTLCSFDALIVGGMVKLVAYANFNNLSFKVIRYNIAI